MTRLIARLVLAMLLLPLTGTLVVLMFAAIVSGARGPSIVGFIAMWVVVYVFIAVYWILLWRGSVRWTASRQWGTAFAGLGAVAMGLLAVVVLNVVTREFEAALAMGGGVPPVAWVLATVLIWRESGRERIERLAAAGGKTLSCPICGYNMTGLRVARCPECGLDMTLDELVSAQPHRDAASLPEE